MGLLKDTNGKWSSKRVVGVSGTFIVMCMYVYSIISANKAFAWTTVEDMIQWGLIAFTGLLFGGSAVEFMSKKKGVKDEQ